MNQIESESKYIVEKYCGCGSVPREFMKTARENTTIEGLMDILDTITLNQDNTSYVFGKLNLEDENYYNVKYVSNLGENGIELVEWCVDFLLLEEDISENQTSGNISSKRYITLWSFVYCFLKIPKDYDYLLMNYLDWQNIVEHGSAIRCAWINIGALVTNPYAYREVSVDRKCKIMDWAKNGNIEMYD